MLLLKAKVDANRQHGNGIMYGGRRKENPAYMHNLFLPSSDREEVESHYELFYVETDFGNHMALMWSELTAMFEIVGVRDYGQWQADRSYLQSQPNLLIKDLDNGQA